MYGSQEDIRYNLKVFFIDGITFMPSMALISITAVIPYFLDQLGATTFQIALATSMTLICGLLTQPLFGYIASRATVMHKTFGKILILQRLLFLLFILLIPVFAEAHAVLINLFLVSWFIFNIFVGSYFIFHTPLVIKLLPPNKRGAIRGIGFAIGSFLGVGMSALIPVILGRIDFPYNYMVIFSIGVFYLLINAVVFLCLRQSKDAIPNEPMSMGNYIKQMPSTVRLNPSFRAMILTCLFLAIANALLPYYTLYAIREFSATDAHIAILAGLGVFSGAIAHVAFGFIVDRHGPRVIALIVAGLLVITGVLALTVHMLSALFIAWIMANLANNGTMTATSLLMGEVSPSTKLPLYVGVHATISMALSAVIVLLLAPTLENLGFVPLFIIVLVCGLTSFLLNIFVLRGRLERREFS